MAAGTDPNSTAPEAGKPVESDGAPKLRRKEYRISNRPQGMIVLTDGGKREELSGWFRAYLSQA